MLPTAIICYRLYVMVLAYSLLLMRRVCEVGFYYCVFFFGARCRGCIEGDVANKEEL